MSDSPAGGWKALAVTLKQARRQTGLLRGLRVLSGANQTSGFDCPGCAWPDPEKRSPFEFCENGAKAILDEGTTRRVNAEFFRKYSVEELLEKSERWLNEQGRIVTPAILREGATHYEPIDYAQAFDLIAERLLELDSPHQAAFYTSGRTSNEAAFLYQLMVRAFGTNNLPDCSNLCHESSGVALKETIGIGKGTVRLDDFQRADLIFVIGQNPGTNHPRMLAALRSAKQNGATIVSVNPLMEKGLVKFAHPQEPEDLLFGGVAIADEFVRVSVNGDQALFRGINKALLQSRREDAIDSHFIAEYCSGFDEFTELVLSTPWELIEQDSGIDRRKIEALSQLVQGARSIICCFAMGLTQHENAVITIQEVTNFLLLRGNVGKPGAGVCPVRGHSNVQGDRTVGISVAIPPEFANNMAARLGVVVPEEPGLDTVATISHMAQGNVRALIALGGNFVSASPDTAFTARALRNCDITVHVSTKLNRSHLFAGKTGIILPCLGRTERDMAGGMEQFVTVENSMGVVHASQGNMPPAHPDLMSEPEIVAQLATRLLSGTPLGERFEGWVRDYDRIRDLIEEVVPGFDDYNRRVRAPGGFELPNGPRERQFTTPSGRAHFIASSLERIRPRAGELVLTTVRSHDQFNTTVYSDDDRYRGIVGNRRVLLVNPADLEARQLKSGDRVRITSYFLRPPETAGAQGAAHHLEHTETRSVDDFVALSYDIPPGMAAAYFPEANPLIFVESFAARSRTPTSKSIRITIETMG